MDEFKCECGNSSLVELHRLTKDGWVLGGPKTYGCFSCKKIYVQVVNEQGKTTFKPQ